jgi:hypothetical protein
MIRTCTALVLAALVATCSSTPPVIPTKNLEHPSDMTFVCLGVAPSSDPSDNGSPVLAGQRMDVCHDRGAPDPAVTLAGQRNLGTFAFIASPGRNEIAVADMDLGRLIDLSTDSPGYAMLPAGGKPESIASTQDGCWIATANRTTCDFTLIDPARLLAPTFSTSSAVVAPSTKPGDALRRIAVRTGGPEASRRTLHTLLGEVAFLPPASLANASASTPVDVCGSHDSSDPKPMAVATFPGCGMVALLEFSFEDSAATIVSAFYVSPTAILPAGTDPICPNDCEDLSGEPVEVDAGSEVADGSAAAGGSSDGGISSAGSSLHLQPLALVPDGSRVYVASLDDTTITSFDIGPDGLGIPTLGNPTRFSLSGTPVDPMGVNRLRLAVDPYLSGPHPDGSPGIVQGRFLNDRGSFLYAFARDESIRVVQLAGPHEELGQTTPVECDANIILTTADVPAPGCFPVGSRPRQPLANGPGIRIPTFLSPDNPPPLPRDISFADLRPPVSTVDGNYHSLSGQFGFVVASNGQVYVLNLAPMNEDVQFTASDEEIVRPAATHSFREARDVGKWAKTPLAMTIAPQRLVVTSDQAFPSTATFSALDGPLIKSFSTDNGATTQWLDFPNPDDIVSLKWDVIWEGTLPQTSRVSGIVETPVAGQPAHVLRDEGAAFCNSGVQPGDVLMFSGCTQNSDCQPDDQFSCQAAVSGARGMCLPIDSTASATLVDHCSRFMGSRMRYEIAEVTPTKLTLQLKLDEVPKTSLNACTQDSDCTPDVDHGKTVGVPPDGGVARAFKCVKVRDTDNAKRCVKGCTIGVDSDCRAGHVCESVPGTLPDAAAPGTGFCVEAPPIDPTCFPQPMTSYSVRAGHAFMVYGSSMPSLFNTTGVCGPTPPADPSLVARIPLSAPECPTDSTFLAQTLYTVDSYGKVATSGQPVQKLTAQAGYNPCLYHGSYRDEGTGAAGSVPPDDHIRAFFQNPQIRFVLTNLDEYAGDLLDIHFELQYGFIPLVVQIPSYEVMMTMGTRIITGPTKTPESPIRGVPLTDAITYPYLYVVDQGRTALTPGSRGQVLRINPRAGSNEIAAFDTTLSGNTPFQLQ